MDQSVAALAICVGLQCSEWLLRLNVLGSPLYPPQKPACLQIKPNSITWVSPVQSDNLCLRLKTLLSRCLGPSSGSARLHLTATLSTTHRTPYSNSVSPAPGLTEVPADLGRTACS